MDTFVSNGHTEECLLTTNYIMKVIGYFIIEDIHVPVLDNLFDG